MGSFDAVPSKLAPAKIFISILDADDIKVFVLGNPIDRPETSEALYRGPASFHVEAALELEQADREESGLLGLGCDLDRTDAMSEAVYAGMNLPTDAVLRSLQLDICDLLKWRDFERRYDERQRRKMVKELGEGEMPGQGE
ncbi:uncharacterized protein PAC_07964 [Phialocephala subalpina]|uniref:Uncharacterized protein n=1 Tax=Phialocephala subalpina TaxID=576137 RepID=A0A1L7WZ84_9HELO|nr:uncharacterized protein PAC_07964 [Phialocephala subalpina]